MLSHLSVAHPHVKVFHGSHGSDKGYRSFCCVGISIIISTVHTIALAATVSAVSVITITLHATIPKESEGVTPIDVSDKFCRIGVTGFTCSFKSMSWTQV